MNPRTLALVVLAVSAWSASAAEPTATNAPPPQMLLLDQLGRLVRVPSNEVHTSLLPPPALGLKHQTPNPVEGTDVPVEVLQRLREFQEGLVGFQWFPAAAPPLMPYLASFDEHGNTTLRPGPLIDFVPFEPLVQGGKYWLAEQGLRYTLEQSFTGVGMSDVKEGSRSLGFYTLSLKAKWAVLEAPGAGTAGWISTQVEAKTGLGAAGNFQSPQANVGTITEPNYNWSSVNGFRVPEFAWQQSLRDGELVALAGIVSQRNYLDGNIFAHTARGEFMNSALVHSEVLPLAEYNFGLNLQWQSGKEWYAMLGASAGDASAGKVFDGAHAWTDFSWNHWSAVGEFGYAPVNFVGLGSGIYRVQPFLAEKGEPTQAGLCFNLQQYLGPHSPFGWFGRFGFGGADVTADAAGEVATGFVMQAPLKHAGLIPRLSNDLLGIGFVWSQPSATTKTIYHENEYILESFYTLQLTPTTKLQPDLQVVWNPAFSPDPGPSFTLQLQLNIAW